MRIVFRFTLRPLFYIIFLCLIFANSWAIPQDPNQASLLHMFPLSVAAACHEVCRTNFSFAAGRIRLRHKERWV